MNELDTVDATDIVGKPSWSPDGRSVAFASRHNGNLDLWVHDIATGARRHLTMHQAADLDPAWSPNGRWMAFSSNRGGHYDLWVMPASGGEAIQLTNDAPFDWQPTWSPNGDRIAFSSSRDHPNPNLWQGGIWIASQLQDVLTEVAPRSWSALKSSYR